MMLFTRLVLGAFLVVAGSFPTSADMVSGGGGGGAANYQPVDHGLLITLGGAAQTLIPANDGRHTYAVWNFSNDTCWINDKGNAAAPGIPSSPLYPSEWYSALPGAAGFKDVSIYCPTTGDSIWAQES